MARIFNTLIFSAMCILIVVYHYLLRTNVTLPHFLFWFLIVSITFILIMEITWEKLYINNVILILKIILFSSVVRLSFYPDGNVLPFFDPNSDFVIFKRIIENSFWEQYTDFPHQSGTPILYILTSAVVLITQLDGLFTAKWIAYIYSVASLLFVYCITYALYRSYKISLTAALLFSTMYMYLMFHSLFIREAIAFALFLGAVYALLKKKDSDSYVFTLVLIIFSSAVMLAHHLTPFLMCLYLIILFLSNYISKLGIFGERINTEHPITYTFIIFFLVICTSYWIYQKIPLLDTIIKVIVDSIETTNIRGVHFPDKIRIYITLFNEFLLMGILGVTSMLALKHRNKEITKFEISFLFWIIVMGILSVAAATGKLIPSESIFMASRFETFAYPMMVCMSCYYFNIILKSRRLVVIFLIMICILINFYRIEPSYYSSVESTHTLNNFRVTQEETDAAKWLGASQRISIVQGRWESRLRSSVVLGMSSDKDRTGIKEITMGELSFPEFYYVIDSINYSDDEVNGFKDKRLLEKIYGSENVYVYIGRRDLRVEQ